MNTKLITLECTLFHISTITNSTHDVIYDPPLKRSSYRKQFITAENKKHFHLHLAHFTKK